MPKTIHSYCGPVQLLRTHGSRRKCEQRVFASDAALGLFDNSTASPMMQEMCALLVSEMPCEQAEPVASRVAGIQISRSTMAGKAQRQGERAIQMREKQTIAPLAPPPAALAAVGLDQPPKPFTLVFEIDTWNIRERDDWGKTKANAYLWAVANQIHGANTPEARQWVKPLLKQIETGQVAPLINTLEEL